MINELKELIIENKGDTELKFLFIDPEDKISLPMFSRTLQGKAEQRINIIP